MKGDVIIGFEASPLMDAPIAKAQRPVTLGVAPWKKLVISFSGGGRCRGGRACGAWQC